MNSDLELGRILNIPSRTLQDFKKRDLDNWRKRVYIILKEIDSDSIKSFLEVEGIKFDEFKDGRKKENSKRWD